MRRLQRVLVGIILIILAFMLSSCLGNLFTQAPPVNVNVMPAQDNSALWIVITGLGIGAFLLVIFLMIAAFGWWTVNQRRKDLITYIQQREMRSSDMIELEASQSYPTQRMNSVQVPMQQRPREIQ
jgi:hypothetical protein